MHNNKCSVTYKDFTSIKENALVSIIKRDDLQLSEVKVWKYVIEWGIAQNSDLPSDLKNWTNENFLTLKNTLKNCLLHIRYFQMSAEDIIDNVRPYQQILEKDLWDDISIKLMLPNRQVASIILPPRTISSPKLPTRITESFSLIINEAHAAEIASWFNRNDNTYSITNNPYEFKLILRGTRDGFTADSFWKLCDKQTHLVIVIKVKDTDEILGGYNPIGWVRPSEDILDYKYCKDSFIFSLKNGTIQNSILSRVIDPEHAILCLRNCGPYFGNGYDIAMFNDFNLKNKCWSCQKSYEKRIRDASMYNSVNLSYFSVEDYEIFQISKKKF
ncbi:hypothetical protein C2G38_2031101 [Gigaspora rosea]|uniref:TLDc domain-containing protein n=1 Tax=Gigaspora rosea TaxID=44941 RepID=A0A397VTT4_9GLOM|nr:hypothetical protein C2G38_2031101 [Gigaspora rosea]